MSPQLLVVTFAIELIFSCWLFVSDEPASGFFVVPAPNIRYLYVGANNHTYCSMKVNS